MAKLGKKEVLQIVKEKHVKFVRLWFTDILGFLKSFAITIRELEGALEEGMGFDGSSIAGFARIDESDMVAMPDVDTFRTLPWKLTEDNKPIEGAALGTGLVGILAAAGVAGYGAATRLPTTPARAGAKPRCSERASSRR